MTERRESVFSSLSNKGKETTTSPSHRILGLDFTKGVLVLFMVLYHWLNYFTDAGSEVYRYLRFVNPSFIFLTGFLISNVYPSKYQLADYQLPRRLAIRAGKILALFVLINMGIGFLLSQSYRGRVQFDVSSLESISAIFLSGNVYRESVGKAAAFHILVPISYLLFISGGLLIIRRFWAYIFHAVFGGCLLTVLVLRIGGIEFMNLDLLTVGFLGAVLGAVRMDAINHSAKYPIVLGTIYILYIALVTLYGTPYVVLLVGVCLSIMLIYATGYSQEDPGFFKRRLILLGRYSLFGYINQIAILQLMFKLVGRQGLGLHVSSALLVCAIVLTILTVEAVEYGRPKSVFVDKCYRVVFT